MPEERIVTSTYVMSVNGLTGNEFHEVVVDANDIRITGQTGQTIQQRITQLSTQVRPLIMEQIEDTEDYVMSLPNGVTISPVNS